MARAVTVMVGAKEWHMPASYKASKEVAETVGDPLQMSLAASTGELNWTTDDVVSVIYIGCKHAGCSLSKDEIGEAVMEGGLQNYIVSVGQYIGAMVMGGPERPISGERKKKNRTGSK